MMPQQTTVPQPQLEIPQEFWPLLKLILRNTWQQFLKNLPWTILFAILTYIGYTLFIIFLNNGYAKTEVPGAALLGLGGGILTGLSGGVIFMLVSGLVAGLVSNAFRRGPGEALLEFFRTPKRVFDYVSEAGDLALASFLSGAGISLVIGYVLTGFGNIATAVGVSLLLFSRAGTVLALLVRSAWNSTYGVAQGMRGLSFGIAAGHVALMGATAGFVIKSVLPAWGTALGIIFLIAALVLAKGKGKSPSDITGLLIFLSILWIMQACPLLAHDGGWIENDRNFWKWVMTLGALFSLLTGLGPAAGILFGAAFVQALLGIADSLPPDFDPSDRQPEKPREPEKPAQPQKDAESQPPLIDPETGQPLIVQDGRYEGGRPGQVWYQDRWMDRGQAQQIIADKEAEYERDRQKWFNERSAEWEKNVQQNREREGFVYNREQDAWVPGANHPETIEAQRNQDAEKLNDFIDRNVKDPTRADFLQNLVDRVKENGGDLDALRQAIKDNTVGADQQRNMGDAESNLAEADAWKESENYATEVQKWSQRANRAIGHFVPGMGGIINMVQGGAYGTVQGYEEGGWRGALSAAAAQGADAALQHYTGAPGIGSALREQVGSGYERDKDGNLVSPLDRMASRVWHNFADQYDPRVYADRVKNAQGIGDLVDVGLDAWDARDDLRDFKNKLTGTDQPDGQVNRETETEEAGARRPHDEDGPRRRPDEDQPVKTRRPGEEVGARPDEGETPGDRRSDESVGARKPDREEPGRQKPPDEDQPVKTRRPGEEAGTRSDESEPASGRKPDESAGGRKPDGEEGELGGDRKDRRPTREDGRKLGEQDSDGAYNIDMDNKTKNTLQQYQAQIRPGDRPWQPQGETMDCTVATISSVTGQSYEHLDANENFNKLRSDLSTEGDHQGGLQRDRLHEALRAAGADAEPVIPRGTEGGPKPGSDEFVRNLEDRINRGEKVVVSMNDPDTGGGHAVHIKGVVTENGITKLQVEDPRRGPLEIPAAVVDKRNLFDWENSYYVKSKDTGGDGSASPDVDHPVQTKTPVTEPGGRTDLGGGDESEPPLTPREKGDLARRQGLSVEQPVAQAVVDHKNWNTVWEPQETGGHGGDRLAESPDDGRMKWLEVKKDQSRENSDNRTLYDRDGKPQTEMVNGEWVVKKGEVMQGSRDWMWQKIHDMKQNGDESAQRVADKAAQAMRDGKMDYVLVQAQVDTDSGEISTRYYESPPEPGATTGVPHSGPGRNMMEQLDGPNVKLPEDYPMGPRKK
jgi:hypothetical protein